MKDKSPRKNSNYLPVGRRRIIRNLLWIRKTPERLRRTNRKARGQRETMKYIKTQLEPRGTGGGFVAFHNGLQPVL